MSPLKCYECASTKDWSTCNKAKLERTCDAGISHCLKFEMSAKSASGMTGVTEYLKLCSDACDEKTISSKCNKEISGQ